MASRGEDGSRADPVTISQGDASRAARRPGRPSRRRSERLTERIVEVATELFLRDGFRATSMDAIAATAGSSKRTVYARFPSKLALFDAVIGSFAQERGLSAAVGDLDGPLEDRLTALARSLLTQAVSPAGIAMVRLLVSEGYRQPELKAIGRDRVFAPKMAAIEAVFRVAVEREEIAVRDPRLLAEQFVEVVCGREMRHIAFGYEEAGLTPVRLARLTLVVAMFLGGIVRHSERDGREGARARAAR